MQSIAGLRSKSNWTPEGSGMTLKVQKEKKQSEKTKANC